MSHLPPRHSWMAALLVTALLTVMGSVWAQDQEEAEQDRDAQAAAKVHTNLPAAMKQAMAEDKTLFITVSTSDAAGQQEILEQLFESPEVIGRMMDNMVRVHVQKKTPEGQVEGRRLRNQLERAREQEKLSYMLLDVERGEIAMKLKRPMDVSALGILLQQLYPAEVPEGEVIETQPAEEEGATEGEE